MKGSPTQRVHTDIKPVLYSKLGEYDVSTCMISKPLRSGFSALYALSQCPLSFKDGVFLLSSLELYILTLFENLETN